MYKIATQVIDFHDDVTGDILKSLSVPDDIKGLDVQQKDEYSKFALELLDTDGNFINKFAIDNTVSTWLSSQYFEKTAHALPVMARQIAAQFISDACNRFDVEATEAVKEACLITSKEINSNFYDMNKAESDDAMLSELVNLTKEVEKVAEIEKFALSFTDYSGNTVNAFPLNSEVDKLAAKEWFNNNYRTLEPIDRFSMASALKSEGMSSDNIDKYAASDYAENKHLISALEMRLSYTSDEDAETLAELAEKKASLSPEMFAKILCEFDKQAGLDKYWDDEILDPFVSVLGITKTASYIKYKDDEFTSDDLKNIPNEKLASYFDKGFIKEFKEQPGEIFDSLPTPEKEVIVSLIDAR